MEHIRVLLVEDERDCREAFAGRLSDHGIAVRSLPDGASLLASCDVTDDADVIVRHWALSNISEIDLLSHTPTRRVSRFQVGLCACVPERSA
jgi:DNA-binding NtrC family response regulator